MEAVPRGAIAAPGCLYLTRTHLQDLVVEERRFSVSRSGLVEFREVGAVVDGEEVRRVQGDQTGQHEFDIHLISISMWVEKARASSPAVPGCCANRATRSKKPSSAVGRYPLFALFILVTQALFRAAARVFATDCRWYAASLSIGRNCGNRAWAAASSAISAGVSGGRSSAFARSITMPEARTAAPGTRRRRSSPGVESDRADANALDEVLG